jgi:peptide/nickel transport system substrate-binding protein
VTAAAPDPLTVAYSLPAPSAGFVNLTRTGLLPEHTLKPRAVASLRDTTDAPTSGPFRVQSLGRDLVALRRNSHTVEPPWLDGIDLRLFTNPNAALQAFIAGDIDTLAGLSPADGSQVASTINRRLLSAGSFAYTELLFNQRQPALADGKVRIAINEAVDRRVLIRAQLMGFGRLDASPIPPAIAWAAASSRSLGPDRGAASRTLDAGGWKRGGVGRLRKKDGVELRLHLTAATTGTYGRVARSIAADLTAIGVGVNLDLVSDADLLSKLQARNFDMALTALDNGPDPDIYVLWHSSQSAAGGFNFSGMPVDAFLDKDLEDGRFNYDIKTRKAAYLDAQKILRADQPAVFLYSPDLLVAFNSRVRGVRLSPAMETTGRYDFVSGWYLNTQRVWR